MSPARYTCQRTLLCTAMLLVQAPQVTVRLSFYTEQLSYSLALSDPSSSGLLHSTGRLWLYSLLNTKKTMQSVPSSGKIQTNANYAFALHWLAEISTNKWAAAFATGRCPCTVIAHNKTVLGHVSYSSTPLHQKYWSCSTAGPGR